MKRTIYDCDYCGALDTAAPLEVTIGREMDAAGDMDDVTHSVDLCPECIRNALSNPLLRLEFVRQSWLAKWRPSQRTSR